MLNSVKLHIFLFMLYIKVLICSWWLDEKKKVAAQFTWLSYVPWQIPGAAGVREHATSRRLLRRRAFGRRGRLWWRRGRIARHAAPPPARRVSPWRCLNYVHNTIYIHSFNFHWQTEIKVICLYYIIIYIYRNVIEKNIYLNGNIGSICLYIIFDRTLTVWTML